MKKHFTAIALVITPFMTSAQTSCYVICDPGIIEVVDYTSCTNRFICNTGMALYDMAITPEGNLYVTDGVVIYKIDTANGASTVVTDTVDLNDYVNALVALDDRYLFGATSNYGRLYKIDLINGTSTFIGTITDQTTTYISSGDLTWYKGRLYYCAQPKELIAITVNETFDQITDVTKIGDMNASAPYGAITVGGAACNEDNLKILVFSNDSMYFANPNNASLQLVCVNSSCEAEGATSITEVSNQTPDKISSLVLPNIFTPNGDNLNDVFSPKAAKHISFIKIDIYNRWGNKVYSYSGNSLQWNGKDDSGNLCSAGTYYYLLEYSTECSPQDIKRRHGYLSLIR